VTELAEHHVKCDIIEWQRLRVAFAKIDLHTRDTRVLARPFEQLRRKIKTAHGCADPCGGDRDYARTTADIENILSSANVRKLHKRAASSGAKCFQPCRCASLNLAMASSFMHQSLLICISAIGLTRRS
jgi:hypothetical protein